MSLFFHALEEKKRKIYQDLFSSLPGYDPEVVNFLAYFMKIAGKIHVQQDLTFMQYGITSGRFTLLMLLIGEENRSLSPSELAKKTEVTKATITQFLDALEKEKYIDRIADPLDKRSSLVHLTQKGEKLIRTVLPKTLKQFSSVLAALTLKERSTLLKLHGKLLEEFVKISAESRCTCKDE